MELVQSLLFSKERKAILNEDKDEETMDPTSHMDDHDYLDQAKPVIIPILERDKNTGIVANISQDNPINEQKGSVYKAKYWFSQKKVYKCHLCHVEISIPPQIGRKGRLAEKIETEHLTSVHGFELKQCKLCNASCVDVEKHMVRRHSFKKCHICGYFAQSKKRLDIHLLKHERTKVSKEDAMKEQVCPNCGKVLPNLKSLQNHLRRACAGIDYAHVVRSISKSNEFPQKRDQRKIYPTYMHYKGLYSLKSFTVGFLIFLILVSR